MYGDEYDGKWIGLTNQNLASARPKTLVEGVSQFDYEAVSRILIYVKKDSASSSGAVYAMVSPF